MAQSAEITYRYRWVVLALLWVTYIVVFLHRLSIGPLAPFLKTDLGITSAQVGAVMSAASIGFMLTLFPVGWVVDRIGARAPMVMGELIAGIAMIALFFVPSYTWLLIIMFIAGLGSGFLLPSTTQGVTAWFPSRERATALGLMQTTINTGGIIGAATLPMVALALGWRYGFLFLGIISIAIGIIVLILYKEPPKPATVSPVDSVEHTPVPLLELIKNREIWMVGLSGFCLNWVEFGLIAHLVLYLTEELLFPVVVAGGLLAMVEASGIIARPGWGILSDRFFGARRRPVFILVAATAASMCLMVSLFGPVLSWGVYPVFFFLGMGGIGFGGIFLTLVAELGGRYGAGKASGLAVAVTTGGAVLGPFSFGYIVDISGSYGLAWMSLAVMAALCIVLLLFVREGRK